MEALHDLIKMGKLRYVGASSMKAWEFSKALYLQKAQGRARFVSLQDTYNPLTREEEREMLPLCADESVQPLVYSPLARGILARPWGETTARSETKAAAGHKDETNAETDHKIVEAVAAVAKERGFSQSNIALAWLRGKSVVAAPVVGALKTKHIDDAIAALAVTSTDKEVARLEVPYTHAWTTRVYRACHVRVHLTYRLRISTAPLFQRLWLEANRSEQQLMEVAVFPAAYRRSTGTGPRRVSERVPGPGECSRLRPSRRWQREHRPATWSWAPQPQSSEICSRSMPLPAYRNGNEARTQY